MRGMIDHLDLTVRDPAKSREFYEPVLGYMGYTNIRRHEDGFDFDMPAENGWQSSIGLRRSRGDGERRPHDRYSPGLHHVAFRARARSDVDRSSYFKNERKLA